MNYWATWCAPCRKEVPKLDAFYRQHHDQNLEMIGISIDRDRDLEKVRKVMAKLAYPVATLKGITVDGFGPPAVVPVTWVIDSDGKVRDMMIDVRDELLNGLVLPLCPRATYRARKYRRTCICLFLNCTRRNKTLRRFRSAATGLAAGSLRQSSRAGLALSRVNKLRRHLGFHSWITTPPHLVAMAAFCIPVLFFAKYSPLAGEWLSFRRNP